MAVNETKKGVEPLEALWNDTKCTMINPTGASSVGLRFPGYDPTSSITYLYRPLMYHVLALLVSDQYMDDTVKEQMKEFGVTTDDLMATFEKYAQMHEYFIGKSKKDTLDEAAIASGYSECNPKCKLVLEALMGRTCLAAFYAHFRKSVIQGGLPSPFIGYYSLEGMIYETQKALNGKETIYAKKVKQELKDAETHSEDE